MSGADTSHGDYVGGLFRSHYDWLCSRLHRHLDSRAHAEDIATDTFVQLLSSPGLSSPGVVPIRQSLACGASAASTGWKTRSNSSTPWRTPCRSTSPDAPVCG